MEQNQKTNEFYDRFNYPAGGEGRRQIWISIFDRYFDNSSLKGKKILDVGCGQGTMPDILDGFGAEVHAVDQSYESIEKTKQSYPNIQAQHADALNLPFDDNTFDHVVSIGVLHHTHDPYRGFQECIRVIRPSGTFLLMLYGKGCPYEYVYRTSRFFFRDWQPKTIPRLFTWFVKKINERYSEDETSHDDAASIIADQLFTPIASFHSLDEIKDWSQLNGARVIGHHATLLKQNAFYYIEKTV